jgi:hypothetical protein
MVWSAKFSYILDVEEKGGNPYRMGMVAVVPLGLKRRKSFFGDKPLLWANTGHELGRHDQEEQIADSVCIAAMLAQPCLVASIQCTALR